MLPYPSIGHKPFPAVHVYAQQDCNLLPGFPHMTRTEWLVPGNTLTQFITQTKPFYSHDKIVRFSDTLGVHPGVAVGQLQHHGEIGWGHSRKFLNKVRHILPLES
jgi:hypothetical protein